jgi:hypothetical protein
MVDCAEKARGRRRREFGRSPFRTCHRIPRLGPDSQPIPETPIRAMSTSRVVFFRIMFYAYPNVQEITKVLRGEISCGYDGFSQLNLLS